MAFEPYAERELLSSLQTLQPHVRTSRNILLHLTIGLTECYSRASSSSHSSAPVESAYTIECVIGKGAFSVVTKARSTAGECLAIKKIADNFLFLGLRETVFLRHLGVKTRRGGKFFVGLKDAFLDCSCLSLVLELYQLTLIDFLKGPHFRAAVEKSDIGSMLSEDVVRPVPGPYRRKPLSSHSRYRGPGFVRKLRTIATMLVSALCVLKNEGIIHADIKPENIFVGWEDIIDEECFCRTSSTHFFSPIPTDHFEVRLGDFGSAIHKCEVSKFYADFEVQSLPYRSPEVLLGVPFGEKIDIWSLGIVLLELCLGCPLFSAENRYDQFTSLSETLVCLPPLLFTGGRFASELLESKKDYSSRNWDLSDHVAHIYSMISSQVDVVSLPASLFNFLALMTHPDPDCRLSPSEALEHEFLICQSPYPPPNFSSNRSRKSFGHGYKGVCTLRRRTNESLPRSLTEGAKRKVDMMLPDYSTAEMKSNDDSWS